MNSPENPYEVSGSVVQQDQHETRTWAEAPNASQGKRFLNFLIDGVIIRLLAFPVGFTFGVLYVIVAGGIVTETEDFNIRVFGWIIGIGLVVTYYIVLEGLAKVSIGKLVTGTRVISEDGTTASFGQILGRSFARLIPFEPLSFMAGDITRGWHDSLSKTRVVDIRARS